MVLYQYAIQCEKWGAALAAPLEKQLCAKVCATHSNHTPPHNVSG